MIYNYDIWNSLSSLQRLDWFRTEVASIFTAALPDEDVLTDGSKRKV